MNEYMIRFTDGAIKHIKADTCKFTVSANIPIVNFFKDGRLFYAINLTSVSAIKFPEVKNDTDDNSRTSSEV